MKKWKSISNMRNMNALRSLWIYRSELGEMLRQVMKGKHRLSFLTILSAVFTFLYLLSPIDFVPDFIPVAGWLDDGFLVYYLIKRVMKETERWMEKEKSSSIVVIS